MEYSRLIDRFFCPCENGSGDFVVLPNFSEPRIIVSRKNKRHFRHGLKIHNTSSRNKRIKKKLIANFPGLFFLNALGPTLESSELLFTMLGFVSYKMNLREINISCYIGSAGRNQKVTFQIFGDEKIIGFLKIGDNAFNKAFIRNESQACLRLSELTPKNFITPKTIFMEEWQDLLLYFQDNISDHSRYISYQIDDQVFNSLIELARIKNSLSDNEQYLKSLRNELDEIAAQYKIDNSIVKLVRFSINRLIKIKFPLVFTHGDFVPYNIRKNSDKLVIFDWEFSKIAGLPFFDLFHFVFQGYHQIFNRSVDRIIKSQLFNHKRDWRFLVQYADFLNISHNYIFNFFVLYLAENLVFDLKNRPFQCLEDNHFLHGLKLKT